MTRYLFDCDGYHIANPPSGLEEVDPRLAVLARDSAGRAAQAAALEDFPGVYNAYSSEISFSVLQFVADLCSRRFPIRSKSYCAGSDLNVCIMLTMPLSSQTEREFSSTRNRRC